jgi:hypothetical protein
MAIDGSSLLIEKSVRFTITKEKRPQHSFTSLGHMGEYSSVCWISTDG